MKIPVKFPTNNFSIGLKYERRLKCPKKQSEDSGWRCGKNPKGYWKWRRGELIILPSYGRIQKYSRDVLRHPQFFGKSWRRADDKKVNRVGMGESITALFRPFTLSGKARLGGLIEMCLYLIVITFLIRFLLLGR